MAVAAVLQNRRYTSSHLADEPSRAVRTSNPQRIGVLARRSQWIREGIASEDFACFVDRTVTVAVDLFSELNPVVELPSRVHSFPLRDAS